jgi:tetratricopeptide (TPR) repeat protein
MVAVGPGAATESEGRLSLLDGLDPDQRRTLAYASAIGREFDFALLVAAVGEDEEKLSEGVEKLVHAGILRERSGGDRFAFALDEVRATIYQSLTASRLRVLHRKVAEAMERLHPEIPDEIVSELGRHYFLGKVPAKAYEFNRRAADIAEMAGDPEEAAHHLERARIDLKTLEGDRRVDEADLAERLGNVYYSMGDARAADRLYREGLDLVGSRMSTTRARLVLARAEVAREGREVPVAVRGARQALEIFSTLGELPGVASVHRLLGRLAFDSGKYHEALEEEMHALDLLQRSADAKVLGRLCTDIGNTFSMLGPQLRDDAVEWYERAIDHLVEVGDWVEVARAHLNLGITLGETDPTAGLEQLSLAREYAERAHELRLAGWALFAGVEMHLAIGQIEAAEWENQQAGRLLQRAEDPMGNQQVAMNAGLIHERRGQWEDAESSYRTAIERAVRLDLSPEEAESQFHLARLMFKTRNLPAARVSFDVARRHNLPVLKPNLAKPFEELGRQLASAEPGPGPTSLRSTSDINPDSA